MSDYQGMRWLKCDLQMQTPADSQHWLGDRLIEGQEAQAAEAFAEACHEAGLDVVGITEHNFLSMDFLPYLMDAFIEIEKKYNHRITLFPGFEFEADVGKGMHVLCLFEPSTDTVEIDHILTECGVGRPRIEGGRLAKSTKRLPEILEIIQKQNAQGDWRGIVIVPHLFQDSLFDNDRISEWLQQEEFRNPELLAVEVPKPVHQMNPAFQKLFRSGEDCWRDWARVRPIATLMSSDNKMLIKSEDDGRPKPNSIGYRYTWIKMSEPSIESLRQAFLDHDSRITLPVDVMTDVHPGMRNKQAQILSISIKGVSFLADQVVTFSPNMNCFIGGRGSGKSTLLEYLRIMHGKASDPDIDRGTRERINRIQNTLKESSAEIKVCLISADGVEDTIVLKNGEPIVDGRELVDPATFFAQLPASFYSQQQLNKLTESQPEDGDIRQAQKLLDLIDGFVEAELDDQVVKARDIYREVDEAFSKHLQAEVLSVEAKGAQQEFQELERQWQVRNEIQEEASHYQLLKAEKAYLDDLDRLLEEELTTLTEPAQGVIKNHSQFNVESSPHASWFEVLDQKVKREKLKFSESLQKLVEDFVQDVRNTVSEDLTWPEIEGALNGADGEFLKACEAKGLSPEDAGRLQETDRLKAAKQIEVQQYEEKIEKLRDEAGDPDEKLCCLHGVWRAQYQLRKKAAEKANELALFEGRRERFIKVTVAYQQDKIDFLKRWRAFSPGDKRTRLGGNWDYIGKCLHEEFHSRTELGSPWEVLRELVLVDEPPESKLSSYSNELRRHIADNNKGWHALRCTRVRDSVDMELFRTDGTLAGSISEGSLSDGQRNTAALALLLSQNGGPLVIDQPEDELDSNFLFRELIPMLRRVKSNRQLIMATHNANLPVNGDSELIYAFEARNGQGQSCAQGGLDQAAVTNAVLDIMEGTEEAFRRRYEKYHF